MSFHWSSAVIISVGEPFRTCLLGKRSKSFSFIVCGSIVDSIIISWAFRNPRLTLRSLVARIVFHPQHYQRCLPRWANPQTWNLQHTHINLGFFFYGFVKPRLWVPLTIKTAASRGFHNISSITLHYKMVSIV